MMMHGNVEFLAMIFVDCKMVLVPGGHVVSNDTNVSVLHLPRNMGTQSRHTTFEEAVPCCETFCTRMRVSSAQTKSQELMTLTGRLCRYDPSSFAPVWGST